MDHPKRRRTDKPRVERDEDDELVILEDLTELISGLRSTVRLMGFLLFAALVILAGMGVSQSRLSSRVTELGTTADHTEEVLLETVQDLEDRRAEPDPDLQAVFEAVFSIERVLTQHREETEE